MRIRDRSTVYLYSISVCMGSFVLGYELTSFSQLTHIISQANHFQDEEQFYTHMTLLGSLLALAAIFGVSVYRCAVNSFGFLKTFKYLDYFTIISAIIGSLSLSISTQILSRLLLGFAVGLNTIIIPTYLTSCLPGSMGGPAGTLNQLFITIGILFGYLMGFPNLESHPQDFSWRLTIALPLIPCLIRLYTTANVFPYETVEYMIEHSQDDMLQTYINHIWQDVSLEQFKASKKLSNEDITSQQVPALQPLGQPYRRRLNMFAFIIFFNQFSGSNTTFAFASSIFAPVVGWSASDALQSFVYLAFLQVVVTFLAGQFLQKYGRRSFMLQGQRVIIVSLVLFGLIEFAAPELKSLQYILLFVHMIGFSLSFGPCSFVIGTQIMHDITYPSILFWILIFILGLLNPILLSNYSPSTIFFVLCGISLIGLFYIGAYLVQTQGKSRQQVYKEFRNMCFPLPLEWRKFLTNRNTATANPNPSGSNQNIEQSRSRQLAMASLIEQRGSYNTN